MLFFIFACSDVEHKDDDDHENEVITTVELSFSADSGDSFSIRWSDIEQSGSPTVEPLTLTYTEGEDQLYDVSVSFFNGLEDPEEDLTEEIADEGSEHQVFFLGTALDGLMSHSYSDEDENGLPIGLENQMSVLGTGEGELMLVLRHMPSEDGTAIKVEGLAELVFDEGFGGIGGDNDVQISFPVTIE
jgi:hypothetical protein